jgi:hypothetical protein
MSEPRTAPSFDEQASLARLADAAVAAVELEAEVVWLAEELAAYRGP